MFRRFAVVVFAVCLASSCGRSNVYRYKPLPASIDAGTLLPDGGFLTDAGPIIPACNPLQVETYVLPTVRRPIDVLFVVDDSRSMKDDQDALAANFAAFIKAFTAAQVDFHLGTVTTDMSNPQRGGRLFAVQASNTAVRYLTNETPELETAFGNMVKVGILGSGNEQGIAAAHAALGSAPDSGVANWNEGFIRPEADLGIVFLSDENDHSPETAASFVTFLKTLKTDTSAMSVAAIVGLESGFGCSTGTWKYTQVAHSFGPRGIVSACMPDYSSTLEAVSGRLVGTSCIVGLSRMLDDDQHLEVHVNGAQWLFFRAAPDMIYPNGSIELLPCPSTGGTVEVIYEQCP
jgi:hypothetical protein